MRLGLISNQEIFQKDQDSLIEHSNTLIEQSLHATERTSVFIPRRLLFSWRGAANASCILY